MIQSKLVRYPEFTVAEFSRKCTSYVQAEGRNGVVSHPVYHSTAYGSLESPIGALQLDSAVSKIAELCMTEGFETSPRGMRVKELLNCSFSIEDPRNRVVTLKHRKISPKYLVAEFIWYLSADPHADVIASYAPFWKQLVDEHGTVNSNYGYHIFKTLPDGSNQWDDVVKELQRDPDSRRAIINIHSRRNSRSNPKDVPCTICLQFTIRENRLYLHTYMRSNDLVKGLCNDVFQFTMFQELMMMDLRQRDDTGKFQYLELGSYTHTTGSMHVYERDFKQVDSYSPELRLESVKHLGIMPPMASFPSVEHLREDLTFIEIRGRNSNDSYLAALTDYCQLQRDPMCDTIYLRPDFNSYWSYLCREFLDHDK